MLAFKKESRVSVELYGRRTPKRRSLLGPVAEDVGPLRDVIAEALDEVDIGCSVCTEEWAVKMYGRMRAKEKASGTPPKSRGRNLMAWKHVLACRVKSCCRSYSWWEAYRN